MKKLLSLALILMVCCTSALLFAGCDKNAGFLVISGGQATGTLDSKGRDINSFEFAVYTGEQRNQLKFEHDALASTVKITLYEDETKTGTPLQAETSFGELTGVHVAGFSLTTVGTRTAKVTYKGATATFQYVVK